VVGELPGSDVVLGMALDVARLDAPLEPVDGLIGVDDPGDRPGGPNRLERTGRRETELKQDGHGERGCPVDAHMAVDQHDSIRVSSQLLEHPLGGVVEPVVGLRTAVVMGRGPHVGEVRVSVGDEGNRTGTAGVKRLWT